MSLKEHTKGDVAVLEDDILNVLHVIARKKATYRSEIQAVTGLSENKVRSMLVDLHEAGITEQLRPSMKNNDPRLLDRRSDMHKRGATTMGSFGQRNWYGLNSSHEWRLRSSDKPHGWYIVDEYHRPMDYAIRNKSEQKPMHRVKPEGTDPIVVSRYVQERIRELQR